MFKLKGTKFLNKVEFEHFEFLFLRWNVVKIEKNKHLVRNRKIITGIDPNYVYRILDFEKQKITFYRKGNDDFLYEKPLGFWSAYPTNAATNLDEVNYKINKTIFLEREAIVVQRGNNKMTLIKSDFLNKSIEIKHLDKMDLASSFYRQKFGGFDIICKKEVFYDNEFHCQFQIDEIISVV